MRAARSLAALALLGPLLLGAIRGDAGETVPLSGNRPGERLDVTLVQVVDPASPAPDDSGRLVGVQLRLENTGSAVYKDSPASCAHLLDVAGQRFDGLNATIPAGPGFPETVTLAPGGTATGFVTFRLPKDAGLAAVQFALNGGLADDVGQWSLS
ncbi:hypothetical protein [Streptomyces sp. NBC_01565]|uniref:hypothetical protein n=1 Tax=unclassified Streptomyces TaxID=2593676 RepID=UPI002250210B|nr:hypothetical protein [Streptomyces sp. NBC_01565]MCX4539702.1 DUF4352 domain-containing protein [Streptomyces sp. NBC_01565]